METMIGQGCKKDIINKLRQDILLWEGFTPMPTGEATTIGLGALESAFPNGVFPVGVIHEMICPTLEKAAATSGLMSGLLASLMQQQGVCLWIGTSRKLFPPALTTFNIAPERIIFIDVRNEKEALWVMEEALKCVGLTAVIAEIREINFAQSRRLQLAVESSRVTGFLLRSDPKKLGTTTCVARWQVSALPSAIADELPGVGFPRWQVDLVRVRNGQPGSWKVEWAEGDFRFIKEETSMETADIRRIVG